MFKLIRIKIKNYRQKVSKPYISQREMRHKIKLKAPPIIDL